MSLTDQPFFDHCSIEPMVPNNLFDSGDGDDGRAILNGRVDLSGNPARVTVKEYVRGRDDHAPRLSYVLSMQGVKRDDDRKGGLILTGKQVDANGVGADVQIRVTPGQNSCRGCQK